MRFHEIVGESVLMEMGDHDHPFHHLHAGNEDGKSITNYSIDGEDGEKFIVATAEYDDTLEIHFAKTLEDGSHTFAITSGKSSPVRVFSTVFQILRRQIGEKARLMAMLKRTLNVEKFQPKTVLLVSDASEPSRVKLYKRFAERATQWMPEYQFTGTETLNGGYIAYVLTKTAAFSE